MATPVLVQSPSASSLATTVTSLTATWSQPPTDKNLLLACAGSDATVTMNSTGWTLAASAVSGQGAYIWYKLAAVGESMSVQMSPSVSDTIVIGLLEFAVKGGWDSSPVDKTISATTVTGTTSLSTGTTAATTNANDLAIALENPHAWTGTAPTSPAWTNGFTNILTIPATTGGTNVALFIASKTLTVKGTQTTTGSWTNTTTGGAGAILATFKINPGINMQDYMAISAGDGMSVSEKIR